jgi:regulatory protein
VRRRALYLLQQQDRTESNLREKLSRSNYPEELVEDAIAYVKSYGYIDDERYAGRFTESMSSSRSRKRVYQDLIKRGIDRELAASAVEENYQGDEREQIRSLLTKKNFDPEHADRKEQQRIYAFLLRRGFSSHDILAVMKMDDTDY